MIIAEGFPLEHTHTVMNYDPWRFFLSVAEYAILMTVKCQWWKAHIEERVNESVSIISILHLVVSGHLEAPP